LPSKAIFSIKQSNYRHDCASNCKVFITAGTWKIRLSAEKYFIVNKSKWQEINKKCKNANK